VEGKKKSPVVYRTGKVEREVEASKQGEWRWLNYKLGGSAGGKVVISKMGTRNSQRREHYKGMNLPSSR